jgi:putative membrane protein
MIKPWIAILVSFYRTPVFRKVWLAAAALGVYSAAVVAADRIFLSETQTIGSQIHGLLGLVLGMLLVFRTNTSYDRWWEARKLWGQLLNDSRNLSLKVAACVRADARDKHELGQRLVEFGWALERHLRAGSIRLRDSKTTTGVAQSPQATVENTTASSPVHQPMEAARSVYEHLERWRRTGQLDGFEFWILDQHAASLMNICGACERIQKTPISFSHLWFIRQSIALYLITLPWGLVEHFQYWAIPFTMLLSYFLVGVELIAEAVEEPFGRSVDDLRLEEICNSIEQSVYKTLPQPSQR